MATESNSGDDSLIGMVLLMVVVMIGVAIYAFISLGMQNHRENTTVPQALPAILGATQVNPAEAQRILAPVWDDIQAVSPLTVTATDGGSSLRWSRVGTDGCYQLRRFLAQNAANAQKVVVIQDAAVLDPGSYADLACTGPAGHIADYTFTFKPRLQVTP